MASSTSLISAGDDGDAFTRFLHRKQACQRVSGFTVSFDRLSHIIPLPDTVATTVPSVSGMMASLARLPATAMAHATSRRSGEVKPARTLAALQDVSGTLQPGSVTLVLAPPGHGKSTLLRALSLRMKLAAPSTTHVAGSSGSVRFGGRSVEELQALGVVPQRMVAYAPSRDTHFTELTVRETLRFAAETMWQFPPCSSHGSHEGPCVTMEEELAAVMRMLKLDDCADVVIGDEGTRGISGGQRKRVTIAEALLSGARVLTCDEITTGLDAAVAFDIMKHLQSWARITNGIVVAALLQPTPEIYGLFDDVLLLRDGRQVYQGPRDGVLPYMSSLGWTVPLSGEADVADWLLETLTHPRAQASKQRAREAAARVKRGEGDNGDVPTLPPASSSDELEVEMTGDASASAASAVPVAASDDKASSTAAFDASGTTLVEAWAASHSAASSLAPGATYTPTTFDKHAYGSAYAHSVFWLAWILMCRQTKLVLRNQLLLYSLPIACAITAAISGSLFYKLSADDFGSKLGCIFYTVVHLGFQGNAEVSSIIAVRPIVYRQSASRMYPAYLYAYSHILWAFPRAVVESGIFVVVLYFLVGFSNYAERFFLFWFLVLCGSLSMSAWLRIVAFGAPTFELAGAFGMPIASMQCIFGGFLITRDQVPKWLLGAYWASPFSWILRAMVRSEVSDPSYQAIIPGSGGLTLGEANMKAFEMPTEYYWIGAAIAFALGFYLLGMFLTGLVITYIQHDYSYGTSRQGDEEIQVAGVVAHVPVSVFSSSSALPFTPLSLVFRNVEYTVQLRKDMGGGTRMLLRGVSGYALPGAVTLLMGASGAGKTTLLDSIASRKNTGVLTGDVFVNGKPKTASFARISAYVEQSDVHSPFVTVREALEFSALMRLPASVSAAARHSFIHEIVAVLELEDVLDRAVGEPSAGGLSASQLKRLSIGVELCSNAALIFLDEPTSGLDATQAAIVMRVIHNLATVLRRTIVTTIHQPSAEIFCMGDALLLLQTGGYEVYCGPLGKNGKKVLKALARVDANLPPCEEDMNPATYMLEVLGRYPQKTDVEDKASRAGTALDWQGVYRASDVFTAAQRVIDDTIASHANVSDGVDVDAALVEGAHRPIWATFGSVLARTWTIYDRNVGYTFGRIMTFVFLGLIFGILYFNVGTAISYGGVRSKISVIFLSVAFGGTLFYTMPMPVLGRERALVYREVSARLYHRLHYGVAVLLTEVPWVFFACAAHVCIMYPMCGFINDAGVFFHYLLVIFQTGVVFTSFGIWFAWLFPTPEIAQIWGGILIALFFIFAGLLSPAPLIGPQWYWLYLSDPVAYAMEAVVAPQFYCVGGLAAGCASVIVPSSTGYNNVVVYDYIESYFGVKYSHRWSNVGWLFLFAGVLTIASLLSLRFVSWIRR